MSNLYDDFEKRFTGHSFSANWVEVNVIAEQKQVFHKDLSTLESELEMINDTIDTISQKQLMLANLAKMYNF